MIDVAAIRLRFERLRPTLNERSRRLWAGAEACAAGWGGIAAVQRATGLSYPTIKRGMREVRARTKISYQKTLVAA